jgi:hypothetical protein
MIINKIQHLMDENEISFCIISDLDKNTIETIGDVSSLQYKDLIEQLFGSMEQIKTLNESLIGQSMPRSWKQGNVKCLVCKVPRSIIIGLFYNEHRSLFDSIDFGNEINEKIISIWN